jgi:hypothetical protein
MRIEDFSLEQLEALNALHQIQRDIEKRPRKRLVDMERGELFAYSNFLFRFISLDGNRLSCKRIVKDGREIKTELDIASPFSLFPIATERDLKFLVEINKPLINIDVSYFDSDFYRIINQYLPAERRY